MKNLLVSRWLMIITIAVIAGFQCYWLKKLYDDEWNGLRKKTDVLLKETVQHLQSERIRNSPFLLQPTNISRIEVYNDTPGKSPFRKRVVMPGKKLPEQVVLFSKPSRTLVDADAAQAGFEKGLQIRLNDSAVRANHPNSFVRVLVGDSTKVK